MNVVSLEEFRARRSVLADAEAPLPPPVEDDGDIGPFLEELCSASGEDLERGRSEHLRRFGGLHDKPFFLQMLVSEMFFRKTDVGPALASTLGALLRDCQPGLNAFSDAVTQFSNSGGHEDLRYGVVLGKKLQHIEDFCHAIRECMRIREGR